MKVKSIAQLSKDDAKTLEKEEDLIENVYYKYKDTNGNSMREYHVDSFETFSSYPLTLSVWRNPQLRPIIIIGQDESVFKQHSFGRQCWFGHSGEAKRNLIRQTDTPKWSRHLCKDHLGLGCD